VAESKENPFVIHPLLGMISHMDVFGDNLDIAVYPFDQGIPLARVSRNGLQPVRSLISNNRPIFVLQSSISVAAIHLHLHPSRKPDFIIPHVNVRLCLPGLVDDIIALFRTSY
jgi:hypothetical protein